MVLVIGRGLSLTPAKYNLSAKEAAEEAAAARRRAQFGKNFPRHRSVYESERSRAAASHLTNLIRRATGLPEK
ncbi:hypothetical protein [Bradyrhizobium genosp. P]|uniref:hypothetical protein n=1 Tax=Bradyrhizobium genosp. P TaxID=83641 RepID=UPI003CED502F